MDCNLEAERSYPAVTESTRNTIRNCILLTSSCLLYSPCPNFCCPAFFLLLTLTFVRSFVLVTNVRPAIPRRCQVLRHPVLAERKRRKFGPGRGRLRFRYGLQAHSPIRGLWGLCLPIELAGFARRPCSVRYHRVNDITNQVNIAKTKLIL